MRSSVINSGALLDGSIESENRRRYAEEEELQRSNFFGVRAYSPSIGLHTGTWGPQPLWMRSRRFKPTASGSQTVTRIWQGLRGPGHTRTGCSSAPIYGTGSKRRILSHHSSRPHACDGCVIREILCANVVHATMQWFGEAPGLLASS